MNTHTNSPKMTKEQVQQKSDKEILEMIERAKGNTGNNFSNYMNCDFSYTFLTSILKDRGYENGWHKVTSSAPSVAKPETILMRKTTDEVTRQTFMIEKSIADDWKAFNQNVPYKTVTIGCALQRFMDDYKNHLINFKLEI